MDEIFRKTVDNPADKKILKLSGDNSEQLPTNEFYASDNKSNKTWKCRREQRSSTDLYYLDVKGWGDFRKTLGIEFGSTIVLKKDNSGHPEADPFKPKATPYKFEV
ncbi:hypothetical protein SLEP1_g33414 [Rubroshorea leprosula]|uniref:TF-B3 domain-containing protein n=1 Tax=Rubroshorea leprosula TaxID=152421 RepID=A0AAV5KGI2_9ROSI|nr:hypothetical protein SLEP1_g33414 [Rubroshorea leprosula]